MHRSFVHKTGIIVSIGLLFCPILLFTAKADVHRCGTLNIRINSNSDTGEKAWDNRKEAMVSVIRDSLYYDIVGLNEVTATQLTYLQNQLGDVYTFVQRPEATSNQVLYRTSKYNCLTSGYYFLAPDPTRAGKAWDAKEPRWAVWVKLQDKTTGDILVFASTHEDLNPVSIREGARVAAEQINLIAGDYACVITGDLNSEPNEHDSHANYGKYLGNARTLSKTNPQGPYGTYIPSMNPATADSKYLDFLYVKNVEIESYRVFNSPIAGRTLAISDHRPVVAEIKVLSPDREFIHNVTTVDELRQVARDIQPNDIIYLKDGTFDLGDTTLYVANTCIIEGSSKAVLTGSVQLFSLPDYISLELRGLTIRNASCASSVQGSIVRAHGAYLKMVDCVVENCMTVGNGLIYTEDCATTLENCLFRDNSSENVCCGLQIVSSLGVDRYPLLINNCLFDNNSSYFAPVLYYLSEATAYLYGNSFVGNTASKNGAVVIDALNNTKDIRLVNNTFVNNRIDVEAGFMVDGVGGSVIWQDQANNGCLTLMNNTIVGNYTACWDEPQVSSTEFAGGAVCSHTGKLALYNNVLAGNYGSKPNSGDIVLFDANQLKGMAYNVFSAVDNMNITPSKNDFVATNYATSISSLKNLYGGYVDTQGAYSPQMQHIGNNPLPVLSPFVTTYAGKNIAVLDLDAMSASMLGSDITNVGSSIGFLTKDQLGTKRKTYSVPGSMETGLVEPSGIDNVNANVNVNCKVMINGQLFILKNGTVYTLTGSCL